MISEATPQKDAPMQRPMNVAQVVYRTCVEDGPNSRVREGKVKASPYGALSTTSSEYRDQDIQQVVPVAKDFASSLSVDI